MVKTEAPMSMCLISFAESTVLSSEGFSPPNTSLYLLAWCTCSEESSISLLMILRRS